MNTDLDTDVRSPWPTTRIAALIVAFDGDVAASKIRRLFRELEINRDRAVPGHPAPVGDKVRRCLQDLERLGLVRRDGDRVVAVDLADLADWVADKVVEIRDRDGEIAARREVTA